MFNNNIFFNIGGYYGSPIVLIGGDNFTAYGGSTVGRFVPLSNNGEIAESFVDGTGFNAGVLCMLKSSYGDYYIGGGFSTYNGTSCGRLVRLTASGTLDTTFDTTGKFDGNVHSLYEDASGNIFVGGAFSAYDGQSNTARIVKLNRSAVHQSSFAPSFGSGIVYAIAGDSSGKIYAGGSFTLVNSLTNNRIIRLNANGSKDTGFDNSTGFDNNVLKISIAASGKIYVSGQFLTYKSVGYSFLIRLNTDGTADTAFDTAFFNSGGGSVNSFVEDSSGNVYCVGQFSSYDGTSVSTQCKLDSTGTLVPGFTSGVSGLGFDIKMTPEEKFFIVGQSGTEIAFVSATGAADPTFVAKTVTGTATDICLF